MIANKNIPSNLCFLFAHILIILEKQTTSFIGATLIGNLKSLCFFLLSLPVPFPHLTVRSKIQTLDLTVERTLRISSGH